MSTRRRALLTTLAAVPAVPLTGCASIGPRPSRDESAAQVRAAEASFAKSMADRDLTAFGAHVAEDAVFFGGAKAARGRAAVIDDWKRFFEKPEAPFSWSPELVEVIEPGRFVYSEGPVLTPTGVNVARFCSVWRYDADGRWRVVFDKGYEVCKAK